MEKASDVSGELMSGISGTGIFTDGATTSTTGAAGGGMVGNAGTFTAGLAT